MVVTAGLACLLTPRICAGFVGGGVVLGAVASSAHSNQREFLGTFTGCFLSFVSPRIIQEIRSIPLARLGGGGAA